MGMVAARAVIAMFLLFLVVIGGVVYYAYSANDSLARENAALGAQLTQLQNAFNAFKANATLIQHELRQLQESEQSSPMFLLRTWGGGLASYETGPNGMTYLRLTETGPNSGVEAALASSPFNATIAGASVQWSAWANRVATDGNHTIWPMVLENSPAGTDAIEFEMKGGYQEAAVDSGGIRHTAQVYWDVRFPHVFKIVVVTPGKKADFYIDGMIVATLTAGVPDAGFLLRAAEVKCDTSTGTGIATLDVYGGQITP